MNRKRFGSWVVIGPAEKAADRHKRVLCRCDCGNVRKVVERYLIGAQSTQCKSCAAGQQNFKYGASHNGKFYSLWKTMVQRCTNPKREKYQYYGARGIKVCDRWKNSFEAFRSDLPSRPSSKHTLDRINNDGDYEPGNIRWATAKEQAQTRRRPLNWEPKGR